MVRDSSEPSEHVEVVQLLELTWPELRNASPAICCMILADKTLQSDTLSPSELQQQYLHCQ